VSRLERAAEQYRLAMTRAREARKAHDTATKAEATAFAIHAAATKEVGVAIAELRAAAMETVS